MQSLNQFLGVTSTHLQIHKSQINNSKSKQQYSFSKATRFNNAHKSLCGKAYYFLPPSLGNRSTSFGIGSKCQNKDHINNRSPSPNAYQNELIKSITSNQIQIPGLSHVRGFSFGGSRERIKTAGIYQKQNEIPGPGTYDMSSTLNKISYSMRPKTPSPNYKQKQNIPGPGTYEVPNAIKRFGNYFISKYISSKATLFNPPCSKRFKANIDHSPGPASYNPKCQQMATDGNYVISKYPSTLCRSFPKLDRLLNGFNAKCNTPGPGAYRAKSEFGYYETITEQLPFYRFEIPRNRSKAQTRPSSGIPRRAKTQTTPKHKSTSQNNSGNPLPVPIFRQQIQS